jgi:hypothetical protein
MARGHVNRSGTVAAASFLDLLTEYGSPWGQQERPSPRPSPDGRLTVIPIMGVYGAIRMMSR